MLLACQWGLERVVSTLIEHHADINKQVSETTQDEHSKHVSVKDADGNTPLHVAIINQHINIIQLLIQASNLDLSIRNKQNQTPFACSMVSKNNEAANLILKREPKAADQVRDQAVGSPTQHTSI